MSFQTLGRLRLKWQERPALAPAAPFGRYLGRGDGEYEGTDLAGPVEWDLFEEQGSEVCEAFLRGKVTAGDGAHVDFEILGFFGRESGTKVWTLASAIRFTTDAPRYAHYQNLVGVMTGTFDMETYEHHYVIYRPAASLAEEGVGPVSVQLP